VSWIEATLRLKLAAFPSNDPAGSFTGSLMCNTCAILGRSELTPLQPSEEHLPIEVPPGAPVPAVGEVIYVVPRHVCPTVNNFDHALLVRDGRIVAVEPVSARGREAPLLPAAVSAGKLSR
jgi:D-serine deaminase-like pyridoxal phosphate-dependent protein